MLYSLTIMRFNNFMIESLITSKTRIRILLKFFLNCQTASYLRGLESEFGESTNSIRVELNKLENAGLLSSTSEGKKKFYYANTNHPLFDDINSILKKFVGIDQIIDKITRQIGDLRSAYLIGNFALGKDSPIIELTLVDTNMDFKYIDALVTIAEEFLSRKIKYSILSQGEMVRTFINKPVLLIWSSDKNTVMN